MCTRRNARRNERSVSTDEEALVRLKKKKKKKKTGRETRGYFIRLFFLLLLLRLFFHVKSFTYYDRTLLDRSVFWNCSVRDVATCVNASPVGNAWKRGERNCINFCFYWRDALAIRLDPFVGNFCSLYAIFLSQIAFLRLFFPSLQWKDRGSLGFERLKKFLLENGREKPVGRSRCSGTWLVKKQYKNTVMFVFEGPSVPLYDD